MITQRSNYTVVLELVTLSPLTHGAGNEGNVSVARLVDYLVPVEDEDMPGRKRMRRLSVPVVTGSSLKSALREHAFGHMADVLGLADGDVSIDQLRLLLKGGKNDAGGASVSLDEARRLRELFQMLAVFGSMDGGLPIRGEVAVSYVRPWCQELLDAGLLPRTVSALQVAVDGRELLQSGPAREIHADTVPVPLSMVLTEEQYYRHDLRTSPAALLLGDSARAALEDRSAARKGKVADADTRREANESMPYTMQAIAAGVPLVAEIRLDGATLMEWECLAYAITRWIQHGARLGGGGSKGHGFCRAAIAGALVHTPTPGAMSTPPGTEIAVGQAGSLYVEYLRTHAEELRAELAKVTRGPGKAPKGKAGKGTEPAEPEPAEAP